MWWSIIEKGGVSIIFKYYGKFYGFRKMDKEYGIARNVTDKSSKLNVAFEQKKAEVKKLSRDFQDLNIRLERAKEDKNNAEIKQCETDIKRVKDDFLKAKQSLLRLKSIIEKICQQLTNILKIFQKTQN